VWKKPGKMINLVNLVLVVEIIVVVEIAGIEVDRRVGKDVVS
jgi:hypothetical protein